jgi:hypothetical protein
MAGSGQPSPVPLLVPSTAPEIPINDHLPAAEGVIPAPTMESGFSPMEDPDASGTHHVTSHTQTNPTPRIPVPPSTPSGPVPNKYPETSMESSFLVYKKHIQSVDLRKLLPPKTDKILWTAISPDTKTIALLNKTTVFIVKQFLYKCSFIYSKTRKHKGEVPVVLTSLAPKIGSRSCHWWMEMLLVNSSVEMTSVQLFGSYLYHREETTYWLSLRDLELRS